jgi:hypothetical protein
MHHRNAESLLWIYDVHLLASSLTEDEFEQFATLAVDKQVAAICVHQLQGAQEQFATQIPEAVIERMSRVEDREPSAAYLRPNRRWIDELASSIHHLPRWGDRLRLLREVAFPHPLYMLKAYGFEEATLSLALLPMLYGHRLMAGVWKLATGRK